MSAEVDNVPSIGISLSDEDRALVAQSQAMIQASLAELGAFRAEVIENERILMQHVLDAHANHHNLMQLLTTRYVKRPGKFDFRADLGSFVERKED